MLPDVRRPSGRPFDQPSSRSHPGALGPYWLYERLGVGGLACVYRARRIGEPNAHDVALKRLHPHLSRDAIAVASFVKEARISYLIDHPVIRRVHSIGREDDELYIVMEYIDGVSLFNVLRRASKLRRRLPIPGVLSVVHRLCDALDYAHKLVDETGTSAGFVHRDVSPSNLIISPTGRLKLIDLGVARAQSSHLATNSGLVKGKYGYMAPEVLANRGFDHRADVYSVGVVMWELLTLYKLYPMRNPPVNAARVRARAAERPSNRNPACPPELDAIVTRALANEPSERWPSCAAMADALHGVAVELDEPLSAVAIAELYQAVDSSTPVPTLSRARVRPRLARGTTGDPVMQPIPSLVAPPETEETETPPPVKRRRWPGLLAAVLTGALAAVTAAALWTVAQAPAVSPGPDDFDETTPPTRADFSVSPLPHRPVDAGAEVDAILIPHPDAALPWVGQAQVTRVRGPWPRSRSGRYRYRAELCIDARGRVRTATLVDGPRRLKGRIEYALRRWRYQPYRSGGQAQAVCFTVASMVHKLTHRR